MTGVVKKMTLVNLLNCDFDYVDDEIIAGTIVKKAEDMERMEETPKWKWKMKPHLHIQRGRLSLFWRFAPVCIADERSEAPHILWEAGYSMALWFRTFSWQLLWGLYFLCEIKFVRIKERNRVGKFVGYLREGKTNMVVLGSASFTELECDYRYCYSR